MPVTLNAGYRMPSWFDLKSLDVDGVEDKSGIKKARDNIHQLIEQEVKEGIPYNRIVLGGFSQGGALALYSSFTNKNTLAGVVALSCWLPLRNEFPAGILGNSNTPILQCHGESDPVVPYKFGELTSQLLKQCTTNSEFKSYRDLLHSSSDEEMNDVKNFVAKCLPEQ
ncbi:Acyl-protein thioesterase 1 [Armadillidium vulgare]|nr:Acyl-protein thioesterase 1 [Armadillidium vulgare]